MSPSLLPCVEITSSPNPVGSVIWLHGLGADGNDFAPIVPQLKLPPHLPLRFIFPHAPHRPVTLNQGYVMRAWFDLSTLRFENIDFKGINESVKSIEALIENEKNRGIPADKIILAGFSQGAAIALISAIRFSERLGGVLALSGCLPIDQNIIKKAEVNQISTPIFMAHGTGDQVVSYSLGEMTYEALKKFNYLVEWHSYTMGHSVCSEEIEDIGNWVRKIYKTE